MALPYLSPTIPSEAEMMDVKVQFSDDDEEEEEEDGEMFLSKSRLGRRRSSIQSADSGIIPSRQDTSKLDRRSGTMPRPDTVDNPKSGTYTRSSTVTSGFRSAAANAETPTSGWLPSLANAQTDDGGKEKPDAKARGWSGLAKLIRDNSRLSHASSGSANHSLRGISRADSYRDVDTSPVFVMVTPEPPKLALTPLPKFNTEPDRLGSGGALPPVNMTGSSLLRDSTNKR